MASQLTLGTQPIIGTSAAENIHRSLFDIKTLEVHQRIIYMEVGKVYGTAEKISAFGCEWWISFKKELRTEPDPERPPKVCLFLARGQSQIPKYPLMTHTIKYQFYLAFDGEELETPWNQSVFNDSSSQWGYSDFLERINILGSDYCAGRSNPTFGCRFSFLSSPEVFGCITDKVSSVVEEALCVLPNFSTTLCQYIVSYIGEIAL